MQPVPLLIYSRFRVLFAQCVFAISDLSISMFVDSQADFYSHFTCILLPTVAINSRAIQFVSLLVLHRQTNGSVVFSCVIILIFHSICSGLNFDSVEQVWQANPLLIDLILDLMIPVSKANPHSFVQFLVQEFSVG
ncbi:unnamed protein product [Protopolystoma xenopodis]|uniref:Uncharacterized protein n=1 Tax=Protopolystoma xenopodis TaxID=117903 RepID=A0A3S5A1H9_9PLAT|nr:unnamed protein product [Protopolystoma xenopodis]